MLKSLQPDFGETGFDMKKSSITIQQIEDEKKIWYLIQSKYNEGKFVEWQQAWGGLFVSSLLYMSKKCLRVALFLADRMKENMYSEISESLGTLLYSRLMGSESYGYPLSPLSDIEKRQKAKLALLCFERAISSSSTLNKSNNDESTVVTWEVQFMIGKCQEKKLQKRYEMLETLV